MRHIPFLKESLAVILIAGVGGAGAETVDFENPAYATDKTIAGADGWQLSSAEASPAQDNFKIQAGAAGLGRWVHALATTTTVVYRPLGSAAANAQNIELRWRWRPLSDSVRLCVGVAGGASGARQSSRASACLEPGGLLSAQGSGQLTMPSTETWAKGSWLYMRMSLDNALGAYGKFTLYVSEDSLRAGERVAMPAMAMGGSGAFSRLVLRDEGGAGYVDLDDFSWEPVAVWQPASDADTAWSNGKNWSTEAMPDSSVRVIFPEGGARGCRLDKNASAMSVTVSPGFKGTLDLGAQTLSLMGGADFTGGAYAYSGAGHIRFPSARSASLIGPQGNHVLPPVRHDGAGTLRLDGRALSAAGLLQSAGVLDFNGWDLIIIGDLQVKSGRPGTLRNLDGRALIATHGARLEGTSKDTLLGLSTSPKGWSLNLSGPDSLTARYALLGNARATGNPGYAYLSADAGGSSGWTFFNVPAFAAQPRDTALRPGETAVFRVSLAAKAGASYQWLRNEAEIPGARDSIYTLPSLRKADSGAVFTCKAANPAGYAFSNPATLKVAFPAPASQPAPQPIADSLSVRLLPPAPGAQLFYSRNGGPWQAYSAALLLRDSTVLRAFAVLGGDTSATAVLAFPKASRPQAAAPGILPEASSFAESVTVTLVPPAPAARVHYTLNGADPDSSAPRYLAPFTLKATAPVRAIAYLDGYLPSPIATRVFTREGQAALPPPTADPAGAAFAGAITVRLYPPQGHPDAALYWLIQPPGSGSASGPFKYADSLVIDKTCELKALAVSGLRASDTARWRFRRLPDPPSVTPKGRIFQDTLRIKASSASDGAEIRYTLDGSMPGPSSPVFPSQGLLLDSSVDLVAVAMKGGEAGAAAAETYVLVPDTPDVAPRGGDYSSRIGIRLASSAPRAVIYYTLDGSMPGPERGLPPYAGPFDLDTNATLKAVAVAGQGAKARRGPMRIENYAFISPGKRALLPGQRLALSGNYSLASPSKGASPVDVEVIAADSVAAGLKGFRDVLFGIRLSLPEGAAAFPPVGLNSPAGEPRALYRLAAPGVVRWVNSADTATVAAPGTYFLAADTAAPVVRYSGETFAAGDSTRLVLTIEDNVQNLSLDLERSDDTAAGFTGREVNPVLILAVNAKNPPGSLRPLTIKLRVDDHTRVSAFPADGSAYPLAQRFASGMRSPATLRIGDNPEDPWDLVALPLATAVPFTVAQLRKNNSAPGLQAALIDSATGEYRFLSDNEAIPPGRSVWLAAPASLPSLAFPPLQTASRRGSAANLLTLHPGWNHVANPGLTPLWWPVSRKYPESYRLSHLKGLHTWNASAGTFAHADSLEPWRGYFAYYKGGRDTVIRLLEQAPGDPALAAPRENLAAGKAAADAAAPFQPSPAEGLALSLAWPEGAALRLGAFSGAADGIGLEDESRPPARDAAGTRLFSARDGKRLETDIARWRPGTVYTWKVVAGLSPRAPRSRSASGNFGVTRSLAAAPGTLPAGYAAWAVSRSRGIRYSLTGGNAVLPWAPGYADTLEVLAGPAAALEARLGGIPAAPGAFAIRAVPAPGGYVLHLDLPTAARLRATLFTLDGRAVDDRRFALPQGRFRLGGGGRVCAGVYALRILASGAAGGHGVPSSASFKLAIP